MPEQGPDRVEESSTESFPASDPPSWEPLHVGRPDAPPSLGARVRAWLARLLGR
jgi:hypothetical protein